MKRATRLPSQLSASLHKRLSAYTLAASAAGVGMLALAQSAEARIIYTPTHVKIGPPENGDMAYYELKFDGQMAFTISFNTDAASSQSFWSQVALLPRPGYSSSNEVVGHPKKGQVGLASALRYGVKIGSQREGRNFRMAFHKTYGNQTTRSGPWANGGKGVTNRYAGLKFSLNGEIHYGWARMSVKIAKGIGIFTVLTGYAFETIPNKPIIAGKTKEPDVVTVQPATLGHLAAGASAIRAQRRSESITPSH